MNSILQLIKIILCLEKDLCDSTVANLQYLNFYLHVRKRKMLINCWTKMLNNAGLAKIYIKKSEVSCLLNDT